MGNSKIRKIVEDRNIKCLYHYTRLRNINSILADGIMSRSKMDKTGMEYDYSDDERLDGMEDRISLSVGFPNYKTFYKKRQLFEDEIWVVLALNPDILWELDCLFNKNNAASMQMRNESVEYRKTPEAFESMFEDEERDNELPSWYTTDVQAEVLVLDFIDPKYIKYINVKDSKDKRKVMSELNWLKKLKGIDAENKVSEYPKLFNKR